MLFGFINIIFKDKETYIKYANLSEEQLEKEYKKGDIRNLSQIELERLQTVPEGYTSIINRNKAASLLGDGWTVDVIAHIFSFLNK